MAAVRLAPSRLHPATLVLALWNVSRSLLLPVVGIAIFGNFAFALVVLIVGLGLSSIQAIARYLSFSYRMERGDLVTRQGLLERAERHIPLARVQDVRIEQGLLHRLLGVADVHVETAGGQGVEASLSVLSLAEAQRLREAVFQNIREASAEAAPAQAAPRGAQVIRRISTGELVLSGLSSNWIQAALAAAFAAWAFLDDVLGESMYERLASSLSNTVEKVVAQGPQAAVVAFALVTLAIVLIGMLASAAVAVALFYGFTLSLSGEDLQRVYGLFTRRSSSLPRRRIQVLEVEERMLRRALRLATLRADTAGSRPADSGMRNGGRDVLLPVVRRHEVESLLPQFLPDLEPPRAWRHVSRLAIRRGTIKGSLLCLAATAAAWAYLRSPWGLWPLTLLPVVYCVNLVAYRNLGYDLGQWYFRTRRGWLGRSTHIVPIRNVQAVALRQSPFDRRLGLATLVVDTAGQAYTGGGPQLSNVPLDEARWLARTLAQRAAHLPYRW